MSDTPEATRPGFFGYEVLGTATAELELRELVAKLALADDCQQYNSERGAPLQAPNSWGVTVVEVLPHLKGQPFDNLALAWLYTLRPSVIRVSRGWVYLDGQTWRVTVHLGKDERIEKITQEVQVGYACGEDIEKVTRARTTGVAPEVTAGTVGHTAGLARIDFT